MKESSRKFVIGAEYLCGIGNGNNVVRRHLVGRCEEEKLTKGGTSFVFIFDINGQYGASQLSYRITRGNNATMVLTAKKI